MQPLRSHGGIEEKPSRHSQDKKSYNELFSGVTSVQCMPGWAVETRCMEHEQCTASDSPVSRSGLQLQTHVKLEQIGFTLEHVPKIPRFLFVPNCS